MAANLPRLCLSCLDDDGDCCNEANCTMAVIDPFWKAVTATSLNSSKSKEYINRMKRMAAQKGLVVCMVMSIGKKEKGKILIEFATRAQALVATSELKSLDVCNGEPIDTKLTCMKNLEAMACKIKKCGGGGGFHLHMIDATKGDNGKASGKDYNKVISEAKEMLKAGENAEENADAEENAENAEENAEAEENADDE